MTMRDRTRAAAALCAIALLARGAPDGDAARSEARPASSEAALQSSASDAARDVKSKDPAVRLAAIDALRDGSQANADELLLGALRDADWEVVERAAHALGERKSKRAIGDLIDLALEGPTRRVRAISARALASIDTVAASRELAKRLSGNHVAQALLALGELAVGELDPRAVDAVAKASAKARKAKEPADALAAASAYAAVASKDRARELEQWLAHGIETAAIALDAAAARAHAEDLAPILALLGKAELDGTLERRAVRAVDAILGALARSDATRALELARQALSALRASSSTVVRVRGVLVLRELAKATLDDATRPFARLAAETVDETLGDDDAEVRRAFARAAGELGDDGLLERLPALARSDPSATVRIVALREFARRRAAPDDPSIALCASVVATDDDALVREEAAVLLAVDGARGAVEALTKALADADWRVAACAAVSLGITGENKAMQPLIELAQHADWRRRGAAIVGLARWGGGAAVPTLIGAIGDSDPAIARFAFRHLRSVTRAELEADVGAWKRWFEQHGSQALPGPLSDVDPEALSYGSKELARAYQDLEVVVLESRGDHIERVLERLSIEHRKTSATKIAQDALHPSAIYVSNCTGEVEPKDLERLEWFVRVGGYLFGSCWSLSQTIEPIYPGVVRRFVVEGDVVDDVRAFACAPGDPMLEGVFEPWMTPIYHLEGAHLIDVVDRDRCEVLIDSPQCAQRWGAGALAVWFRAGHGVIVDTVNHVELQGLETALGLKTAEQRMAYAFDHMGLDYGTWRETRGEKWWGSSVSAAKHVVDLSAFRFITNFVRKKRKESP